MEIARSILGDPITAKREKHSKEKRPTHKLTSFGAHSKYPSPINLPTPLFRSLSVTKNPPLHTWLLLPG